ncbi:MAG: hypothetical protein ACRER5_02895 [Pseudomonas sp.]
MSIGTTIQPNPTGDRLAIRLLVQAGLVTEAKANQALNIAHGFDRSPLEPGLGTNPCKCVDCGGTEPGHSNDCTYMAGTFSDEPTPGTVDADGAWADFAGVHLGDDEGEASLHVQGLCRMAFDAGMAASQSKVQRECDLYDTIAVQFAIGDLSTRQTPPNEWASIADGGPVVWCKPSEFDDAMGAGEEDGARALFVTTTPKGPYTFALRTNPVTRADVASPPTLNAADTDHAHIVREVLHELRVELASARETGHNAADRLNAERIREIDMFLAQPAGPSSGALVDDIARTISGHQPHAKEQ